MKLTNLILFLTVSFHVFTIGIAENLNQNEIYDISSLYDTNNYYDNNANININNNNNNNNNNNSFVKKPNSIDSRIMGGDVVTDISDFCYQVGIKVKVNGRYGWCGGSIISRDIILTAAHCLQSDLYNISEGIIYLGVLNRDAPENGSLVINFNVSDYIVHDMWSDKYKTNDIALIKLNESLTFTESICGIDLISNKDAKNIFENETVLISGWGRSSDDPENYEPVMKYATVKVLDYETCHQRLWQTRLTNICVSSENMVGACKGDSGGPLVYSIDNTFKRNSRRLIGITSFTGRGCQQNFPRVYTKVGYYLGWICRHSKVCEIIFPDN